MILSLVTNILDAQSSPDFLMILSVDMAEVCTSLSQWCCKSTGFSHTPELLAFTHLKAGLHREINF